MNKLYITIGLPGAGKTTYYDAIKTNNSIHLSSDKLREKYFGDENTVIDPSLKDMPEDKAKIQSNKFIFNKMKEETLKALKEGKDVYYDATNLSANNRRDLIKTFKDYTTSIEAIDFTTIPLDVVLEQNTDRDKVVPLDIMNKMKNNFVPPSMEEGFDKITVVEWKSPQKEFDLSDDGSELLKYKGDSKIVFVPSSVEKIAGHAFENNQDVEKVILKNVDKVSISAFENCSNLKKIVGIEKASSIDDRAFFNSGLKSLDLSNAKYIGTDAITHCDALKEITLNRQGERPSDLLMHCDKLKTVYNVDLPKDKDKELCFNRE